MDFGLWIRKGAAILTFHSDFGMTHFEALGFPKGVKCLITNSALWKKRNLLMMSRRVLALGAEQ